MQPYATGTAEQAPRDVDRGGAANLHYAYEADGSAISYWENGGVWPFIPDDWTPAMANEPHGINAFHWKSGYHEAEHALVARITTSGLTGQPLPLYYALVKPPAAERIQPYYFTGEIASEHSLPLPHHPELHGRRVEFRNLR